MTFIKSVVPTLLVLGIWFLAVNLFMSTSFSCDVIDAPCSSNIHQMRLISVMVVILAPLIGGLYILLIAKDLKFAIVFCGVFYTLVVLLIYLNHFLFGSSLL